MKGTSQAFFAPSLTLCPPTEHSSAEFVPPGQPTKELFKRFDLRLLERSDFKHVVEYRGKLKPEHQIGLTGQERDLVLLGAHPKVGLFVHRLTGEPLVRTLAPVAKGEVLGQFAAKVTPDSFARVAETSSRTHEPLSAYRRQVFAWVQEFATNHIPTEFAVERTEAVHVVIDVDALPGRCTLTFKDDKDVTCCSSTCTHADGNDVFSSPQAMADHVDSIMSSLPMGEDKEGGTVCPWGKCGLRLASKQGLRFHIKAVHCNLVFKCSRCGKNLRVAEPKQAHEHARGCGVSRSYEDNKRLVTEMVVPERVKIRFDASECCNIFALARSDELMNLPKNAHIVGSILGGFPHLLVEALDDLPAGTELIFDWGDLNLGCLLRYVLFSLAAQSHASHIYRQRLEVMYNMFNLRRPQLSRARPLLDEKDILWLRCLDDESKLLTFAQYKKAYLDLSKAYVGYKDEALPVVSRIAAFQQSECTYLERSKPSVEAKRLLARLPSDQKPPRWQDEFSDKIRAAQDLLWSMEAPSIEIRRIDYLFHPVRFLNPPGRAQFGVFARVSINPRAPIVCYKGEIITQQEHDHMSPLPQYAFDFTMHLSLHINADDNGNEGRYVNDCFGRIWEKGRSDSSAANASYLICWDETAQIPVLFIVAKDKQIAEGEEIVVDYGSHFWNPLMHELIKRHSRFLCRSRQITAMLASDLASQGVVPPPEPTWADLLKDYDSHIYRSVPYGALCDWELDREEEEVAKETDVECILKKRVMPFGTQYLVKWSNFDYSHNSWVHEGDAPREMVADFEAGLQAELGQGGGIVPKTRRQSALQFEPVEKKLKKSL